MRTINLTSPKDWSELTPEQLLLISGLYLQKLPETDFLVNALIGLTELTPVQHKVEVADDKLMFAFKTPGQKPFFVESEKIHEMANRLKWLLDPPAICTPPNLGNYIPVNNRLFGVCLEQYLLADAHYIQFAKTQDRLILDKFAAALYRSDENEQWSDQEWKKRIPHFTLMTLPELNAVFIWFTGVKAFIMAKYPYVFPGTDGGRDKACLISPDEQILQLLANLNGGDVTRNGLIMETHVHEVLYELNLKIENSQNNNS